MVKEEFERTVIQGATSLCITIPSDIMRKELYNYAYIDLVGDYEDKVNIQRNKTCSKVYLNKDWRYKAGDKVLISINNKKLKIKKKV